MKTDKTFAMSVSSKYMQIDDPEALAESLEISPRGDSRGSVHHRRRPASVLKELAESSPAAASATPSQFYDNRFLKEAVRIAAL